MGMANTFQFAVFAGQQKQCYIQKFDMHDITEQLREDNILHQIHV